MNTEHTNQSIPGKKRGSVLRLVLLTIATLGVYSFYWLFAQKGFFTQLQTEKKFPTIAIGINLAYQAIMVVALLCITFLEISATGENSSIYTALTGVFALLDMLGFVFLIMYYYALFIMKGMIDDDAKAKNYIIKTSGFFVFFFGLFYIQYLINKIPETGMMKQPTPISAANSNV